MSGGNASGVERSQSPSYPPPIIDGEGGALAADRIFLRCSPVGYVCVGLGAPTRLLRFAFEHKGAIDDPSFAAACRRLGRQCQWMRND